VKGLVLAGGSGTRLRPLTYSGAKQLVPVANRPVLFYVLDNLVDAGIREIAMIISPETGAEVRAACGDGSRWGATIHYVAQDRPSGLAHAVLMAKEYLAGSDFCMFLGDKLIGTKIREAVDAFRSAPELGASVMLKEVPNPSSFGVAEVDAEGNVVRLVEKPKEPKSNLALVGIYLFRPSIFDAIARIKPSPRGELEITDAIAELISLGKNVRFSRVTSWWLDTGKKDDLLLANDTVLDDWLTGETLGVVDEASRLSGRVRIEEGATVERSVIRGPVVIGRGARIVDARIGPFTSIGDRVVIERSSVDHSVVMEGSRIEDIPRLEDSLIGRRVVVAPGTAHAGALSLLVGDDCKIDLAPLRLLARLAPNEKTHRPHEHRRLRTWFPRHPPRRDASFGRPLARGHHRPRGRRRRPPRARRHRGRERGRQDGQAQRRLVRVAPARDGERQRGRSARARRGVRVPRRVPAAPRLRLHLLRRLADARRLARGRLREPDVALLAHEVRGRSRAVQAARRGHRAPAHARRRGARLAQPDHQARGVPARRRRRELGHHRA
jgi:glucose-1-phosphate thymidylyltransferase